MPLSENPWYASVFDRDYIRMDRLYHHTDSTRYEARRALCLLDTPPRSLVLDLCCGYGRHALEMAALGYVVVGVDLSEDMLAEGRKDAQRRGLPVRFVRADMRRLEGLGGFHAVTCFYTSFGYLESEEEDLRTLQAVARCLRPEGRFFLDLKNRVGPGYQPTHLAWSNRGIRYGEETEYRAADNVLLLRRKMHDGARRRDWEVRIRQYEVSDLIRMHSQAGLDVTGLHGDYNGCGYRFNSPRMILVSRRMEGKDQT